MISSGTPPTRVATGGTPQAIASSAASPNDSISLGISNDVRQPDQPLDVILLAQEVDVIACTPSVHARCSAGPRSGPSPTISRRTLACLRTSARMRMQSSTRFTGRKLERWISSFSPLGANSLDAAAFRIGLVSIAVDEIVDDADFVLDAEDFDRLAAQIFADGGDAVGLFDGEFA